MSSELMQERLESGKEAEDVVHPKKSIHKYRQKILDAKKKDAERKELAKKNESPEQRARRLAKIKECNDRIRPFENERNRKRRRERVRREKIRLGIEVGKKKESVKVRSKVTPKAVPKKVEHRKKATRLIDPSTSGGENHNEDVPKLPQKVPPPIVPIPRNLGKPLLKRQSSSEEVNSPPITGCRPSRPTSVDVPKLPENVKIPSKETLERLHKEQLEREAMRPLLRAQFSAIYQNFCVSQQTLIKSIHLAIVGVQIPLIDEEIPNYFDVLIPGFLIRKMKYTMSNIERNTIHGNTFISHQFYSFFKFLFGKMKNGTTMSQVIVDPRLIEVFSFRFPLENFEELWRRTMEEAVSHHFDVIYTFDPENRMVVPIYRKKKS